MELKKSRFTAMRRVLPCLLCALLLVSSAAFAQEVDQAVVDKVMSAYWPALAEAETELGPFYTWTVKQKSDFDVQWRVEPYLEAGMDITQRDFYGYPPEGGLTDEQVREIATQALLDLEVPQEYLDKTYLNLTYWVYGHPDDHNDIDWTINFDPYEQGTPYYQGFVCVALDGTVVQADFGVYNEDGTEERFILE